jgi:large subunit ribosomal protein L29
MAATTTPAELRELTDAELVLRVREAKEELFNLRFQNVTGQLDNSNRLGEVRRDIARIFTVMRERELAGGPVARTATPATETRRRRLGRRNRRA